MEKLIKLKELLLSGKLPSKDLFNIGDFDKVLDEREIEVFENEWMRVYNFLKRNEGNITQEAKKIIDSIREQSFRITYNVTESSDLAGYISDDFGLLAEALFLDYQDEWINALATEYINNRIPRNRLKPLAGRLENIIKL